MDIDDLARGWGRLGLSGGMTIIVHSSLSSLGPVTGGAGTVVASFVNFAAGRFDQLLCQTPSALRV